LTSGDFGIDSLKVGKNATKARVRTATVASLAPNAGYWKKVNRPMSPIIHIGISREMMLIPGYLYIGILK
jgi:hypothetical protein